MNSNSTSLPPPMIRCMHCKTMTRKRGSRGEPLCSRHHPEPLAKKQADVKRRYATDEQYRNKVRARMLKQYYDNKIDPNESVTPICH